MNLKFRLWYSAKLNAITLWNKEYNTLEWGIFDMYEVQHKYGREDEPHTFADDWEDIGEL